MKRAMAVILTVVMCLGVNVLVFAGDMGKTGYFNTVSLGELSSAAITEDGSLYTWGSNSYGQLGLSGGRLLEENPAPVKVTGLSNVVAVIMGRSNSAAITADGSLYTWGWNNGQLGLGDKEDRKTPTKVPNLSNVIAVSMGNDYSAAVTADGSLYTWGDNRYGKLGLGDEEKRDTPTKVPGLSNVVAVSLGELSSAAITKNGELYTWNYPNDRTPTKVPGLANVVAVSSGYQRYAAITADGSLYTWGSGYGLGLGGEDYAKTPTKVPGLSNVVAVSFGKGQRSNCGAAVTADGSLYVWGSNRYGQLGLGDKEDRKTPTKIPGLSNVVAVSLGEEHSAAVTADGSLYVWGDNYGIYAEWGTLKSGRLGLGDSENKNTPTKVTTLPSKVKLSGSGTSAPTSPQSASERTVKIIVDGKELKNAEAYIKNDRTVAPVALAAQAFGFESSWDAATQTSTLTRGSDVIKLTIGKKTATFNGKPFELTVAPFLDTVRSRNYIPVADVAKLLDLGHKWDGTSYTVTFTTP